VFVRLATRKFILERLVKMTGALSHHGWFKKNSKETKTTEGVVVDLLEFQHQDDEAALSAWAKHFRNHYCLDSEIDIFRKGTGKSRAEYLKDLCFPDGNQNPGPSVRSGDFSEILVADYLQFVLGYWVPRTRYPDKVRRNKSVEGTDVIGFYFAKAGQESSKDELFAVEVKAQLTGTKAEARLQEAVAHSAKDDIRKAESLNAMKKKLLALQKHSDADKIERFQNIEDRPFVDSRGAAAVFSSGLLDKSKIKATTTNEHPSKEKLKLFVFHGKDLMVLVNSLYDRAADEA
jgi:hypothetical protein